MKSIKASLLLGLLLGFGLLLGIGGFVLHSEITEALVERFDSQLHSEAMTIVSFTKQERDDIDVEFTDPYLREYDDDVGTRFYQVVRPDGRVEDRSESLEKKKLPARYGTSDDPLYFDLELPNGKPGRAIGFKFVPQSKGRERRHHDPDLLLGLVVAADRSELNATLASIRAALLAVGVIASLGAVLIVGGMVGLSLRPVGRFANQMEQLDANALGTRIDTRSLPAELRPIAHGLNRLLERLEFSFKREKQFSSDVAHELRTPIAELRSLAEVGLKWPNAANPAADSSDALRDALGIARQMDGIVSSLLAISRAETGKQVLKATPLNVADIVAETWKPLEETAALRQLAVSFQVPASATIQTDRYLFGLILKNLLENAVHYTPRRGSIRLSFGEQEAPNFSLVLANTTEDLTAADMRHLFERFWRKEEARSGADHSGLGLSLARAYARTLDYELKAKLVGHDIIFTMTGPRAVPGMSQE